MINAERVIMKYPQFRLKIDLSKFFHDARELCWIFIDGTKIRQIIHIQQHISKLFSIAEPFHLLLNNIAYLPPTEDVRVLKENETIQVIPGSGLQNKVDKAETCNDSIHDKQVHTTENMKGIVTETVVSNTLDVSNDTLSNTQLTSINNTQNMTFYSVIDDTVIDDTEEDNDSKVTDNNLTEDCNMTDSIVSIAKRKRVRRRKPKNQSKIQFISSSNINEEDKPKKPKIIDSYIIPSGKHIRFDNTEKEESNIAKQIVQEVSGNESYVSKTSSTDLSTLLALGQSSTPITFINKKIKNEVKMENELNDGSKTSNKIFNDNISTINLYNKEKIPNYENLMHSDLEIIPVTTRKPQVKDIIAFKTLKIGADYTPQVSNFIVAEVIGFCAKSVNYYLKIIKGKEEIKVPLGKFSLSEDTPANHCETDTFILNYSQMQELRLLSKPSVS